jgi:hypothetical protein
MFCLKCVGVQASADSARNRWASVQQKARDDAERIRCVRARNQVLQLARGESLIQ